MAGLIPKSYQDLRVSENGNKFGAMWNRLLMRLDEQRIVLKPGLFEENVGTHRAVGVTPVPQQSGNIYNITQSVVAPPLNPFQIYQHDPVSASFMSGSVTGSFWRNVRIHQGFDLPTGKEPPTDDAANSSSMDYTLPVNNVTFIWMEANLDGTWTLDNLNIVTGSTAFPDQPIMTSCTGSFSGSVIPIGYVGTSPDSISGSQTILNISQVLTTDVSVSSDYPLYDWVVDTAITPPAVYQRYIRKIYISANGNSNTLTNSFMEISGSCNTFLFNLKQLDTSTLPPC